MDALMMILSAVALLAGFLFLSEATTGVGIIAAAGVLGIWARIAQATKQHKELKELIGKEPAKDERWDD